MESKSREQFESWIFDDRPMLFLHARDDGSYRDIKTQALWCAWQASRAALVVELPQRLSPGRSGWGYTLIPNDNGDSYHCDDILRKLLAAGITAKGDSDDSPT